MHGAALPALAVALAMFAGTAGAGQWPSRADAPPELLLAPQAPSGPMELEMRFRAALDDEDYDAALIVGETLLPEWEARYGRAGGELVEPLTALGRAQRHAGAPEAAESTLSRAVDIAREVFGPFSAEQVDPLVELGHAYREMGEHMVAVATYSEAQGLSRRALGLFNPAQLEMLDGMATSLLAVDAYEDAVDTAVEAFRIAERRYGAQSPELLPALYRLARWYRRTLRFVDEREMYMRAVSIIERDGGDTDLRLVIPLRSLAGSLRNQQNYIEPNQAPRSPPGHPTGRTALSRALDVVRAQDPVPRDVEARLLVDLGDWQMAAGRRNAALDAYREAWQVLELSEQGTELREQWFASPFAVTSPQPSWLGIRPRDAEPGLEDGIVVARYRVNTMGRAEDVDIVESHPPGLKESTVRRTLNRTRFRPSFADGEPATSPEQTYEFKFAFEP